MSEPTPIEKPRRTEMFFFRCTVEEKALLEELGRLMGRKAGDAVRFVALSKLAEITPSPISTAEELDRR